MSKRESSRRKRARGLLLRHGYAVGGHVLAQKTRKPRAKRLAEGAAPGARADKPRRAAGGRTRKPGTKVIIINGHPQPFPVPRPVPMPLRAAPPVAPPPGLPPVAGLSPAIPGMARPPLAKRGGRIARPRMTAGAKNALGRLERMRAYGKG